MAGQRHVVIVGAGLTGAATARELVRRGQRVTVLERDVPASEHGSSHGSARIFRYAYPDALYTDLVVQSRQWWDELEDASGQTLISGCGAVDHGPEREPARLADVLASLGVEHELLGPQEAAERWPALSFDSEVLWHPGAGVIDAERAVEAMIALAVAGGAELRTGVVVTAAIRDAAGWVVETSDGESLRADDVVVAAGGWLPDLLPTLGLPDALQARLSTVEVRKEQAFHFPYRDVADTWPTFIHKTSDIQVYGLPGGRDADMRGQKVAEFNGGPVIASAAHSDGLIDDVCRDRVVAYVERYLPGLVPEPYAETTCLFTNTEREDFVIDTFDALTIASPCSGHGAKFAPLIGRIVAAAVLGEPGVPARFRVASNRVI